MAEVAHEPLVREIRLTWWSEALEEIFSGRPPRQHPVAEALKIAIDRRTLPRATLDAMIEARLAAIETGGFDDEAALDRHLAATEGALMNLAVTLLEPGSNVDLAPAARAWGLAGFARLRRAGVDRLPRAWSEEDVRARVKSALVEARGEARALPTAAFPALAYVTLAGPYAAGREPSELERRLRLVGAVATGRL